MSQNRINKLQQKRQQIDAQLQDAKARQKQQKRKDDTRRKIIAGGLALSHAEANPDSEFNHIMLRMIQHSVTRKSDRALFGLDPLPQTAAPDQTKPTEQTDAPIPATGLRGLFARRKG